MRELHALCVKFNLKTAIRMNHETHETHENKSWNGLFHAAEKFTCRVN